MTSAPEFEVFFDGACPLCAREIAVLRWLDRKARIRFTDIADPSFDPTPLGMTWNALMEKIRGRLPDGQMVEGVEVFRRMYAAIGLRWLASLSRLPGLSHGLELGYRWFAQNRLRLTGRCVKLDDGTCALR